MGWTDRRYTDDGGGGFRSVLRRIFGDGENPLEWSVPLYTAWGIRVRVSIIYLFYIIISLLTSFARDRIAFPYMAIGMASLFLLVLLHEYGHCFACRWVGGTADRILMWPLGGLASCQPPHDWRSNLVTTLGGPGVNVVLAPVLALPLYLLAGQESVLFNPFSPGRTLGALYLPDGRQPYWLVALWFLYYANGALLLFNMLLPMYPMDAGRVVQELLWRRMGYHRATSIAASIGLAIAIAVVVAALVTNQSTLLGIGLFCGFTCWAEKRRLAATVDEFSSTGYDFSRGYQSLPADEPQDTRAAEKRRKREEADQQRLDGILAKIAQSGMSSLSRSERAWLRRTTEKRRRG